MTRQIPTRDSSKQSSTQFADAVKSSSQIILGVENFNGSYQFYDKSVRNKLSANIENGECASQAILNYAFSGKEKEGKRGRIEEELQKWYEIGAAHWIRDFGSDFMVKATKEVKFGSDFADFCILSIRIIHYFNADL